MSRVLIWMSPEAGHLIPTLKMARDLRYIGVDVVYLTCGNICTEIASRGFNTQRLFTQHSEQLRARSLFRPCGSANSMYALLLSTYRSRDHLAAALRSEIKGAAKEAGADLVVVDGTYDDALSLDTTRSLASVCPVLRLFSHLPYPSRWPSGAGDSADICLAPVELELPQYIDPKLTYTEACILPAEFEPAVCQSIDLSRPIVYVSLGTQAELYEMRAFVTAIMNSATLFKTDNFVIQADQRLLSWLTRLVGRLLPNVQIAESVPQRILLAHAMLAITHGGFNTFKECVWHRVPMIVFPQRWDQHRNAERILYFGIGSQLSSPATPTALASLISTLRASTGVRDRLRSLSSQLHSKESATLAADECIKRLATPPKLVS